MVERGFTGRRAREEIHDADDPEGVREGGAGRHSGRQGRGRDDEVQRVPAHRAIDAVFRIESARLIAGLARLVRDVGLAEELAQDALVVALEQWPASGVPRNPGAWLMAVAKRRAIDQLRRRTMLERKHEELGREIEDRQRTAAAELEAAVDDDVGDDLLRLMFTACHPVLSTETRVALTLRLLGGLRTEEIARAFLVPEPTVAQRIVRAKRTLAEARVPFEVPRGRELAARLSSVLEVVYLIFNEGYSATGGDDWMRPALCEDALLNRAVAVAMAFGPAAGLEIVDALTSEPSLEGYHLLPSVRGDLLGRLGRFDEACAECEGAASLTRNTRERELAPRAGRRLRARRTPSSGVNFVEQDLVERRSSVGARPFLSGDRTRAAGTPPRC
jgi:RNA polymerase sigma factor (sigma-70 family)